MTPQQIKELCMLLGFPLLAMGIVWILFSLGHWKRKTLPAIEKPIRLPCSQAADDLDSLNEALISQSRKAVKKLGAK